MKSIEEIAKQWGADNYFTDIFSFEKSELQAFAEAYHKAKLEELEPVAYVHRNEYDEYRLEPTDNFRIKDYPVNVDVILYTLPSKG